MNIETKLKRFSDVVLKEAEEIKKKKVSAIDEKHESNVKEYEKKAKTKYADMLEDASISAEKQKQKRIAQKNAELKKELIQKRSGYINNIFDDVLKRLEVFFKTPEYEQLIVDSIESYAGDSPREGITAYIMERDFALQAAIEKKTDVTVLTTEEDFLGGVRILLGNNRAADCTLKRRLEHERSAFNKIKIV